MYKIGNFFIVALACLLIANSMATKTIDSHLNSADRERLHKVFSDGTKSNDIQSIYYGSINYKEITGDERQTVCKRLMQVYEDSKLNEFEKNFYISGAHKELNCPNTLAASIVNTIKKSLDKDYSTTQEMFYNVFANKAIGSAIEEPLKIKFAKNIQTILKKDESLNSLAYAFHIGTELGSHAAPFYDYIDSAFGQADEVDGKMLQFEGGLSVTALLVNGALKLTRSLKKQTPLTEDQAYKFSNYFISRRSVQLTKGASILLDVLNTIVQDPKIAPIAIQLIGNGHLSIESPVVSIKVVDLLGRPITQPAIDTVHAVVQAKPSNTQLLGKTAFVAKSSDKTVYSLDLSVGKPVKGTYAIDVTTNNGYNKILTVKILAKVKVNLLEIGVGYADSISTIKKQTIEYPKKIADTLVADSQQKVIMKVLLSDEKTGKPLNVHQAFVRLEHRETKEEIIFIAEEDVTKSYKFDMDVGARSIDFGHRSGTYKLELIIGDVSISNSFNWYVCDIQLNFSQEPKKVQIPASHQINRAPQPEIIHQFREPEKRPAKFVSDLFTGLCASPLLILFIIWMKLNVNISNFPFSLTAIGFHLGLGSILTLFGVFWWKLNMFDTLRYLLPLLLLTFLCGNRLLRSIAGRRQTDHKEK